MALDSELDSQIQFARHNFDNHQALIRLSDTKAGVTITVMAFLAASALQISKDAISKLALHPCSVTLLSVLFVVAAISLLVAVFLTLAMVLRVLHPRGDRYYGVPEKGRDLMWQRHVLLHESNEVYFGAVRNATPDLILRNLTDQVYELAHISSEKMDALKKNRWVAYLGFGSWVLIVTSGFFLVRC